MDYLYRAKEATHALGGISVDSDWEFYGRYETRVKVKKYKILKTTKKGVWVKYLFDRKFVNLTARKKFASTTIVEAYEQLYHRKSRQIKLLKTTISNATEARDIAKCWLDNNKTED